jgi:hypothetical protein
MPIVKNRISKSLDRKTSDLVDVPRKAHKYFKNITPKRTGNAKRKTRLKSNIIHANYEYASYLDDGSSKQAPKGMTEPTKDYLNKLVTQIMRKK